MLNRQSSRHVCWFNTSDRNDFIISALICGLAIFVKDIKIIFIFRLSGAKLENERNISQKHLKAGKKSVQEYLRKKTMQFLK